MNLTWNVFRCDMNNNKIEEFNIFDHWRFKKDVEKNLKQAKTKEEFSEQLRRDLMYYFWSKCEHEVYISGLFSREKSERKIDSYEQVMLNYNAFVDFVWQYKKNGE